MLHATPAVQPHLPWVHVDPRNMAYHSQTQPSNGRPEPQTLQTNSSQPTKWLSIRDSESADETPIQQRCTKQDGDSLKRLRQLY